jgi:hypothetical protein
MKNRDAQMVRLRPRISYYRVIQDTRLDASSIRIHWRRALLERVSHYETHFKGARHRFDCQLGPLWH